ncbi:MAG TPA: hypothetical protein VFM02_02015 [Candidatus Paceibacterota bacterium]|nr:hypothetical protein [Candidatus Paceibacterota bacterium]
MGFESFSFSSPQAEEPKEENLLEMPAEISSENGGDAERKNGEETRGDSEKLKPEVSEEKKFEIKESRREMIRAAVFSGALTMLSGCAHQTLHTNEDLLDRADNPTVAELLEKVNAGVEGECNTILHQEFRALADDLPNEWSFSLARQEDGKWHLVKLSEGDHFMVGIPYIGNENARIANEVCDFHSHPLADELWWDHNRSEEDVPSQFQVPKEIIEQQEEFMREGKMPAILIPPSAVDIASASIHASAYGLQMHQVSSESNLKKYSFEVVDPGGVWNVEIEPGSLSDFSPYVKGIKTKAEFYEMFLSGERWDVLLEYVQTMIKNNVAGAYSMGAYEAYQMGILSRLRKNI